MEIELARIVALREELAWFPCEMPEALLASLQHPDHPARLRCAQLQALFESHGLLIEQELYASVFEPVMDAFGWVRTAHLVKILQRCLHKHGGWTPPGEDAEPELTVVKASPSSGSRLMPSISMDEVEATEQQQRRTQTSTPNLSCYTKPRRRPQRAETSEKRPSGVGSLQLARRPKLRRSVSSSFPALNQKATRPALPVCVVDVDAGRRLLADRKAEAALQAGELDSAAQEEESRNQDGLLSLDLLSDEFNQGEQVTAASRHEDGGVCESADHHVTAEEIRELQSESVTETKRAKRRRRKRRKMKKQISGRRPDQSKSATSPSARCAKFTGRLFVNKEIVRKMVEEQKKKLAEMKISFTK